MDNSCHLLQLPFEIRKDILFRLLHCAKPIQCSYLTGYTWRNQVFTSILRTCGQLHKEGGQVLAETNTVLIRAGDDGIPSALYRIQSWIITIRTDAQWHILREDSGKFHPTMAMLQDKVSSLRTLKIVVHDRPPRWTMVKRVTNTVKIENGHLIDLPEAFLRFDRVRCNDDDDPEFIDPHTKLGHIRILASQTTSLHPADGIWLEIDHFVDTRSAYDLPRACLRGRCHCIDKHLHRS